MKIDPLFAQVNYGCRNWAGAGVFKVDGAIIGSFGAEIPMSIVDVLLEKRFITPEQVAQATELRNKGGMRLDRALVELCYIDEQTLLQVTSERLDIPLVDLANERVDVEMLKKLPPKLVHRKHLLPLGRDNGSLRVATSDPYDLYALDELRLLTGLEIHPVLASEAEIDNVIKQHFGVGGDTIQDMMSTDDLEVLSEKSVDSEDLLEMAQEASVIKLVNEIFLEALNERATDIHVEPYENDLSIRYRIDGVLHQASLPPHIRRFQAAIISRIKIMANMNIAEKRLPQDGRIKLQAAGKQIDVRVSVIPMLFGEGIVMRLLNKSTVLLSLPQLGMANDTHDTFRDVIQRPHGIVLVTGPTGSGKTTTLYAALAVVISPEIKVLTVEDPVEYHLDGVNQIQVQSKIGMTFAAGLRAILRHDPDVVMIGEIRDGETAEAAIQAALTGHLVFSTLHTNDAASAPTRLVDMGIEPFLVTSTLEAAMAQRLVRTICADCKESYTPDPEKLPPDLNIQPGEVFYRGRGCKKCHNTGYYGRLGLFELLVLNEPVRERIMTRAPSTQILEASRTIKSFRLLREDGWLKVRQGLTTPEEVIRSTKL